MKAKDVRGFMVEKRVPDQLFRTGFNEAIDQQGEREITLSREKLINLIGEFNGNLNFEYHIKLADAIIAAEADILESKNERGK